MSVTAKGYKIPQIKLSYVADVKVEKPNIMDSGSVSRVFRETYDDDEIDYRESFKVAYLNRANKVVGVHTISSGGTAATVVDLKMIFSGALLANATSIILCHNHPSGSILPSPQDDSLTRKMVEAGKILEIRVLDHVIITRTDHYSYADNSKL
ncbi:MAG: JAB domain-containing protein [Bacteroides sp.]|nr:JAB domain-containing protein [Bacteroides sp.]